MKKENIKKAGFIINEIERIEAEIVQLDKIAQLINSNQTKIKFKLSVEDLDKKESVLDEDGSIKFKTDSLYSSFHGLFSFKEETTNEKYTNELKQELSDIETYEILGLLLSIKKGQINSLKTFLETL